MKTFVMYTTDNFNKNFTTGGIRRYQELVEYLLKNGDRIHLFAPEDADVYKNNNLLFHPVVKKKSKIIPDGLVNFIYNYKRLRSIRKMKYDNLIIMSIPYAIQVALIKLKRIILLIRADFIAYRAIRFESTRNKPFHRVSKKIYIFILTTIERYLLLDVDKVIVQCDYDKEIILGRQKKIVNRIEPKFIKLNNNVNPSWIEKYKDDVRRIPIQKAINDHYNFAFIGNINDLRKGVHLLLAAWERLREKYYKIALSIIGGGTLLNHYKIKYRQYNDISFLGHLPDPLKELKKSDLLIVPSLADSFPNTIMEALYLETPVIGSRRGGIPEILVYDELLFEADSDSLYEKISDIIKNSSLEKLRQLCIKRKRELTFDWGESIQMLLHQEK